MITLEALRIVHDEPVEAVRLSREALAERFDWRRQAMLRAWRELVVHLDDPEVRDEVFAMQRAMTQIHWLVTGPSGPLR